MSPRPMVACTSSTRGKPSCSSAEPRRNPFRPNPIFFPRPVPTSPENALACRRQSRGASSCHSPEPVMSQLDQVLAHLDTHLDAAVERLFAFLRIPSISTDPAYKKDCVKAAEHLKADVATLGFDASLRPTKGHPGV